MKTLIIQLPGVLPFRSPTPARRRLAVLPLPPVVCVRAVQRQIRVPPVLQIVCGFSAEVQGYFALDFELLLKPRLPGLIRK